MTTSPTCIQCGKPAIGGYGGNPLCVEHYLMMQQADYLLDSRLAALQNHLDEEGARGTGYLVHPKLMEIPRPPFWGDKLTLNNINVSGSTIGAINTGTVQRLDASITLLGAQGQNEIASAIKDLTEAVIESKEVNASVKNQIAEQLAFLVAQVGAKQRDRSLGIARSVLDGIRTLLHDAASLLTIYDKLKPLIEKALFGSP